MKLSFIRQIAVSLFGLAAFAAFNVPSAKADRNDYRDYEAAKDSLLDRAWAYNKVHGMVHIDSVRAHILDDLSLRSAGKASLLKPASRKKLTPDKIYEKCKRSSLWVGRMEHNDQYKQDRAYPTASAVALTADGICVTNYHVVADLVLSGAVGYKSGMETMRFLTDWDGNIFPIEKVLYVNPLNDFAIIKVLTAAAPLVPASVGEDLAEGKPVYCLSHTTGSMWNLTDGLVSRRTKKFDRKTGETVYNLVISADYGVGASGGPIFDECGNLASIVSSTLSIYAQPQQFRNFQMTYKLTVPVFLIKECFAD